MVLLASLVNRSLVFLLLSRARVNLVCFLSFLLFLSFLRIFGFVFIFCVVIRIFLFTFFSRVLGIFVDISISILIFLVLEFGTVEVVLNEQQPAVLDLFGSFNSWRLGLTILLDCFFRFYRLLPFWTWSIVFRRWLLLQFCSVNLVRAHLLIASHWTHLIWVWNRHPAVVRHLLHWPLHHGLMELSIVDDWL